MEFSRTREIQEIQRECRTSEYRGLPQIVKACKLVLENKCPKVVASEACQVTERSITRGNEAIRCGREIGKNGNPRIFNEAEEYELYIQVRLLSDEKNISNEQLRDEVKKLNALRICSLFSLTDEKILAI